MVLCNSAASSTPVAPADRDHQRVVGDAAGGQDLDAFVVDDRRHEDVLRPALEPRQRPEHEGEMVPARLREVVELVRVHVHAAGGDLVQERLPQVRAAAVDEGDAGLRAVAVAVAQLRRELEPAGAAADHHDAVHPLSCRVFSSAAKSLALAATISPDSM